MGTTLYKTSAFAAQ